MFTGGQIKSTAVCCANGYYGRPASAWLDDNGSPNILRFFILVSNSRSFEARKLVSCHLWLDDNGSQSKYSCTPFMSNICSENIIAFFFAFVA